MTGCTQHDYAWRDHGFGSIPVPVAAVRCFAGGSRCSGRRSVPSALVQMRYGEEFGASVASIRKASTAWKSAQTPAGPARWTTMAAVTTEQFLSSMIAPFLVTETAVRL